MGNTNPETFRCLANVPNNVVSLGTNRFDSPLFLAYIKSNKLCKLSLLEFHNGFAAFHNTIKHATNLRVLDAGYHDKDEINWARMPKQLTDLRISRTTDGFWGWFADTNMTTLSINRFNPEPTLDQMRALGAKLIKLTADNEFSGPQLEMLLHEGSTISELQLYVTSENTPVLCVALTRRGNALRVLRPQRTWHQNTEWAMLPSALKHDNCMLTWISYSYLPTDPGRELEQAITIGNQRKVILALLQGRQAKQGPARKLPVELIRLVWEMLMGVK